MIVISAFDVATLTGAATGSPGQKAPDISSFNVGGSDVTNAEVMANFIRLTATYFDEYGTTHLFVEGSIPGNTGNSNYQTHLRLTGLSQAIGGVAVLSGVPAQNIFYVYPQTIRKFFLGISSPKDPKAAVKTRCRQLGWGIADDNEADAAALWAYAEMRIAPDLANKLPPVDFPIAVKPKKAKAPKKAYVDASRTISPDEEIPEFV